MLQNNNVKEEIIQFKQSCMDSEYVFRMFFDERISYKEFLDIWKKTKRPMNVMDMLIIQIIITIAIFTVIFIVHLKEMI